MQNTTPISFRDIFTEIETQKYGEDEDMFYERCVGKIRRFAIETIARLFCRGDDEFNMSLGLTAEEIGKLEYHNVLDAVNVVRNELLKMGLEADVIDGHCTDMYLKVGNLRLLEKACT